MRHFLLALAMLLFCLPGAGCRGLGSADGRMMEGAWVPVAAELSGRPFPDAVLQTMKLTLEDGRYIVDVGGQLDVGTVKIAPKARPRGMDITGTEGPNRGKTFLAIYEMRGDTLRICYDLAGQERPTEFRTLENTKRFLVKYKRVKG